MNKESTASHYCSSQRWVPKKTKQKGGQMAGNQFHSADRYTESIHSFTLTDCIAMLRFFFSFL